jgi:hypothetical protein
MSLFFCFIGSSSSSTCSTPNDRSLARAIFDINTVLVAIGLGRYVPTQLNCSPLLSSTPSSNSSSTATIPKISFHQTIPPSTSETKTKYKPTPSSSAHTTPSPSPKKQHKRTCSSPITSTISPIDGSPTMGYRARPFYSPVRPNSLVLPAIPPPPPPPPPPTSESSSRRTHYHHSDPELADRHVSPGNRSIKISSTPEEDVRMTDDDCDRFYSAQSSEISTPMVQPLSLSSKMSNSQPQLNRSHILDIETDEQIKHQTKVLPPKIDGKKTHVSQHTLERDFLH